MVYFKDFSKDSLEHLDDFALWKLSSKDEPGWKSPLNIKSPGRPGWHTECAAMISSIFKHPKGSRACIDIHGGGCDLKSPHHKNEFLKYALAYNKRELANHWIHNELVRFNNKKMSKSANSFIKVKDILNTNPIFNGMLVRFALMQTHYRKPLNWTDRLYNESKKELIKYIYIYRIKELVDKGFNLEEKLKDISLRTSGISGMNSYYSRLYEDMNIPEYMYVIRKVYSENTDKHTIILYGMLKFIGIDVLRIIENDLNQKDLFYGV